MFNKIKQYSDRGKISELNKEVSQDIPFSPAEIRLKKLYEYASTYRDKVLQKCLGFITTDFISDKNAFPLNIYRLKELVRDINSKSPDKISQMRKELENCFIDPISDETKNFLQKRAMIKTAGIKRSPSFRRAS